MGTQGVVDYEQFDPGIRDVLRKLHAAGFVTCDSGDGVTKEQDTDTLPYPHVFAPASVDTMIQAAEAMAHVLGPGWTVEASYQTHTRSALLLARTLDPREL